MSLILYNNQLERLRKRSLEGDSENEFGSNNRGKPLLIECYHSRKLLTWKKHDSRSNSNVNSPINSRRLLIEYLPLNRSSPAASSVKRSNSGRILSSTLRGAVVIAKPLDEIVDRTVIENPFITEEGILIDNYLMMSDKDWEDYVLGMGSLNNITEWYNNNNKFGQNLFNSIEGYNKLKNNIREGFISEKPITNPFIGKFTIYFPKVLVAQTNNSNVYKCSSSKDDEWYALKVMAVNHSEDLEAARKEIDFLEKCKNCSYIIKMIDYDINEIRGEARIVMEWGEQNAHEYVMEMVQTRWTTLDISLLMSEMLRAVKELHSLNIVHNDIKEANFMKVKGKIKLTDLGACHELPPHHPFIIDDQVMGTDGYYAPERLRFERFQYQKIFRYDYKSDVYSLGCVFVRVLTGKFPFKMNFSICGHCESIDQLSEYLTEFQSGGDNRHDIIFRRRHCKISEDWKQCILRALCEDPAQRISIDQMCEYFQI